MRGFIQEGSRAGARLVVGGTELPDGVDRGWYVRPTLFADIDNGMRIAREEIFGPLLSVIPYAGVARGVRTGSFGVNQPYSGTRGRRSAA